MTKIEAPDEVGFCSRAQSVRRRIVDAIFKAGKGHLGGALSAVDLLLYLYERSLVEKCYPANDRVNRPLILSKGHSATALLAVLDETSTDDPVLEHFNADNSLVGNNPCEAVPGIEFHTGSLGHGVGLACGVALAQKFDRIDGYAVVMISDGELLEGSTWEGLLFAASNQLNVCVIVDRNHQICEDFMRDAVDVQDVGLVLKGLGLSVLEIDGHSFADLQKLDSFILKQTAPRVVIARTIKGKGVSFMESEIRWHHSIPNKSEYTAAMSELMTP